MRKRLKFIFLLFISIILIVISVVLFRKSYDNYVQDTVLFEENSAIDYKVYLMENSYFETPYLGEDEVYITSLIDYIDIDFSHLLKLEDNRSGRYVYSVKGIMSANVSNTDKGYWSKVYDLVPKREVSYDNTKEIKFVENVKINYQDYNNLLLAFKEDFKLSLDGFFKVVLYVENFVKSDEGDELKQVTTTTLEIPLTKSTIEVPIDVREVNRKDVLLGEKVYRDKNIDLTYRVGSAICLLIGGCLIIYSVFKIVRSLEKISLYNKELKKILKTYDGIIVNVSKVPNYNNFKLIDVSSFNELLDAHGEIRQPISYYENNKQAVFTLINNNIIWRYVLRDRDYEKK